MLSSGGGLISEQLSIVLLCKQLSWDYYTYMRQPAWFVDLIRLTNNVDAEYQEKLNRQIERQSQKRR